ncbi:MAG: hypothetical protein Q7S28_04065 [bacterium]|nr:hypothetical protein [bacterium]
MVKFLVFILILMATATLLWVVGYFANRERQNRERHLSSGIGTVTKTEDRLIGIFRTYVTVVVNGESVSFAVPGRNQDDGGFGARKEIFRIDDRIEITYAKGFGGFGTDWIECYQKLP